jgi:hypothetical protein
VNRGAERPKAGHRLRRCANQVENNSRTETPKHEVKLGRSKHQKAGPAINKGNTTNLQNLDPRFKSGRRLQKSSCKTHPKSDPAEVIAAVGLNIIRIDRSAPAVSLGYGIAFSPARLSLSGRHGVDRVRPAP